MNQKNIVFVEPSGNESNVFENYMHLPLTGTLYLGTILHNLGHHVRILNECILDDKIDPFTIQADIYCISALTVSANRAKSLAGQFKRLYPQSRVLVGGIHASLLPHDFAEVADQIVVGEAEGIIADLIDGKITDKIVQGYPVDDVDTLPLLNYSLLEGIDNMSIIPLMTSRGCPFDCNFCTVTKIFGKQFRMQSPERVLAEVKNALTYFKSRHFFFYDDNLTANRDRVARLSELLIKEKVDITWTAQVRSDVARSPELLRSMSKAGCRWFYIGFESTNDATLKAMHKSQTKADIETAIQVIHNAGINIHGMFIFGEDNDTVETLKATVDFAIHHDIDTVQFMILTPFPGTALYNDLNREMRIYHENWDYYNGMFAVFQPKNMSAATLQKEAMLAYRRFYSLRRLSLDLMSVLIHVFIDALVWNFKRAMRYGFDMALLRAGASLIILRFSKLHESYLKYLATFEMRVKR